MWWAEAGAGGGGICGFPFFFLLPSTSFNFVSQTLERACFPSSLTHSSSSEATEPAHATFVPVLFPEAFYSFYPKSTISYLLGVNDRKTQDTAEGEICRK
jgi:hypothetical protein